MALVTAVIDVYRALVRGEFEGGAPPPKKKP